MARNVYGLDLGTYDIKIFDKKKDRIWHAKNVIAMKDKKYIFSVGNEAYKMYEKAPGNIQIIFPMKNGVIARFDDMQYLLGDLLKEERPFIRGAEYVIAVPTDVTEVEKKAFYDLVLHSEAKAKSVRARSCRRTWTWDRCSGRTRSFYCQFRWRNNRTFCSFLRWYCYEPSA